MRAEIRVAPSGDWYVFVDGKKVMGPETYQVAANVEHAINHPELWEPTEAYEIAETLGRLPRAHLYFTDEVVRRFTD